jgi:tRNA pseudouridine13 synthase
MPVAAELGLDRRRTPRAGTGGRIRTELADFRVDEVEAVTPEPLDADPGAYPHVVVRVRLQGWDTNAFAHALARGLAISTERITWAGTKDAQAITTQLFTIRSAELPTFPTLDGASIEPIGRLGRSLRFGDLWGNRFEIVVRDAEEPEQAVAVADSLESDVGPGIVVPNVFGPQRFGSHRPITHRVGAAIVDGRFRAAVRRYLTATAGGEPPETAAARSAVADAFGRDAADWGRLTDAFGGGLRFERALLQRMSELQPESATDWRDVLDVLPWNLQRLFVHAFQAALFNRMVVARMRANLPLERPLDGDRIAFIDEDAPEGFAQPDLSRQTTATSETRAQIDRHCRTRRAFVVGPLVGTETVLTGGQPGEIERTILADAGVEPEDFDLPEPYHSTGTLRPLAVHVTLQLTIDEPQGGYTLRFALPSGSYATAVTREFIGQGELYAAVTDD